MIERPAYKRLETDAEFRARVALTVPFWVEWLNRMYGEELDHEVFKHCNRAQRRIVEVFP